MFRKFILLFIFSYLSVTSLYAQDDWPALISDHEAITAQEHPRLLFRENDLPRLREFAHTPEGQALLNRLRKTLNGSNGETLPTSYNPEVGPVDSDGSGEFHQTAPLGSYTFSHMAGYGFLYQITGDDKYAELGYQCFLKALEGYRDRDRRYAFKAPYGALRAGPVLGWTAIGFDLCYDGWNDEQRKEVCLAIANYHENEKTNLDRLTVGSMPPFSNHFGMQTGGAALGLLAINKEPWVDQKRIDQLLKASQYSMIRNLTEGFGDGGFYAEGDGTGSMASHIIFITALQAWKNAGGKDFISPRPNAPWTALKWIFLTIPKDGVMDFWPKRGAYPHNVWDRDDKSGSGYFAIGFAGVRPQQRAAMLWFYNHHLKQIDAQNQTPFDTPSPYPHFAICSYVNWPWDMEAKNPAEVLPNCYRDSKWSFYAFRNRWQDENDIVISVQTKDAKGYHKAPTDGQLKIMAFGEKESWGKIKGDVTFWEPAEDGSAIMAIADGTSLAIDFSGSAGVPGLLVMTGPGASGGEVVEIENHQFHLMFLTDQTAPKFLVVDDQLLIGNQTVSMQNGNINLEIFN